jgi:hypothetical protein
MGQLKKPETLLFEWTIFRGFVANFVVRRRTKGSRRGISALKDSPRVS